MSATPLRLMIYDRTCTGRWFLPGLTHSWMAGGVLYRVLERFDHWRGARSWEQGLTWLAQVEPERPIAEIQFWGHGKWGQARVGNEILDIQALRRGHLLEPLLRRIRDRMIDYEGLWWFRTCETFGAERGHAFARAWSEYLGCDAGGHTYTIGFWQSGLHCISPGYAPHWPSDEGLAEGTPARPEKSLWSRRGATHTISCLRGRIPSGF